MANSSTDTALFADDATEPLYRNTNYVAYATTAYKVSVTLQHPPGQPGITLGFLLNRRRKA